MNKFEVNVLDDWDDTYMKEDVRELLKNALGLEIVSEKVFDDILEVFIRGDKKKTTNMDKLTTFKNRLSKIGIEITLSGNIPWIYLSSVNGKE